MAIVKLTYTKSRKVAKKNIRYMQHRPGKDGAKIIRTLFNQDGELTRKQAYSIVDDAQKGSMFFRIVISPDPEKEDKGRDLYLWQVTEQTMLTLEDRVNRLLQWVATEHSDHATNRHIHLLAALPRKLTRGDLEALRSAATKEALFQRLQRDLTRQAKERAVEEAQWAY